MSILYHKNVYISCLMAVKCKICIFKHITVQYLLINTFTATILDSEKTWQNILANPALIWKKNNDFFLEKALAGV